MEKLAFEIDNIGKRHIDRLMTSAVEHVINVKYA